MSLVAVILAAGKGTRMGSELPKVLHRFLGEPLVVHPIRAARAAGAGTVVVVVGHGAAEVETALADQDLRFALQPEQRGTGHAVQCALPALAGHAGDVLILSGDVPRLRPETLDALVSACAASRGGLALATFTPHDPTGYGRIVRDGAGAVAAIVEERDASPSQRAIGECNAGVYCARAALLRDELPRLGSANAQGEIYLTDLVAVAVGQGGVGAVQVPADEVAGVNTRAQLVALEAAARESSPASA